MGDFWMLWATAVAKMDAAVAQMEAKVAKVAEQLLQTPIARSRNKTDQAAQ